MALRKVLDKLGMKSESKNAGSAEPDKASNSSGRSHDAGGEAKKKMKKVRSIRVAPKKTVLFQPAASKETEPPPHFMKSTTSYATRKETTQVTIISSTSTAKTKNANTYTAAKAPVKSTAKTSMTAKPEEEDNHDCTYPYCSLHEHKHGAVPSLKRFLSTKMQNSMKQRGYSLVKKRGGQEIEIVEDVVNELFIEIQTKLQEQGIQIEDVNNSFEDCGDQNRELSLEEIQVINQFLEFIDKEYREEEEAEEVRIKPGDSEQKEAISHKSTSENNFKESRADFSLNMSKVKRSRSRRQAIKNRESANEFNPRPPPRLLEPRPEPEKEQVNLRHQAANERKAAEEWMVDFALKKTLGRLTSARRTKVPALVAAFESVLPQKI
ncbi:hypothetical protein KSP40_PGU022229 [Platanthera guangdongensis]|uniref:Calmodulin-binding domain-containing protein n=1 Tax=Platanthera guangdongensis TaxID=2320717 RepID=A0ABR2MV67_9ASPA